MAYLCGEEVRFVEHDKGSPTLQCPAQTYVEPILELIKEGKFDATDIITHWLSLDEGEHAYEIFDRKQDNCIKVVLKP